MESPMRSQAKEFAKKIVFLAKNIRNEQKEPALANQLLRAGTSIAANIYEAQYAQSSDDFISKLKISLKECHETEFWLDLLYETNHMNEDIYNEYHEDCIALKKMLIASLKTMEKRKNNN